MLKKFFSVFLLGCFMVCVLPVQVLASQQHAKEALLKKLIVIMQRDLQASDKPDELSPISLRTQSLLNDLLIALESKNNKQLKAIVDDYATDMAVLQDETPVNPQCLLSLWGVFDMLSSLVSTLRTIAAGGDNACLIVDIASNLGSIIAAIQSYRICEIMNSELPDQTLCQQIVQRQTVIKMYNYIAKVLNVLLCSGTPAVSDYVSLVWGFLGLFPGKDVCTPQVPAT